MASRTHVRGFSVIMRQTLQNMLRHGISGTNGICKSKSTSPIIQTYWANKLENLQCCYKNVVVCLHTCLTCSVFLAKQLIIMYICADVESVLILLPHMVKNSSETCHKTRSGI